MITDETIGDIDVEIPDNPVFKLLDIKELTGNIAEKESIAGVPYVDINKCSVNKVTIGGHPIKGDQQAIYLIYFRAASQAAGEFIENFYVTINGQKHLYRIGADFYGENELLQMNLANFGIELPQEITKAIGCSNVHEDKIDYILLNRKLKELISNYWDIIANKGSYKSLENSLKWFEYGDSVKLKEIWMS